MTRSRLVAALICLIAITASAANSPEVDKEIEGIVQLHGEAALKAEQLRLRTVEKSRQDTIASLTKLAVKAYTTKDRLGETGAWKAVLRLDRDNKTATQYFADLGNLDKILAEFLRDALAAPEALLGLNGKWRGRWDNQGALFFSVTNNIFTIQEKNGTITRATTIKASVVAGASTLVTKHEKWVDRLTLAGDKILVEEWFPAETYPKDPPRNFDYAVRVTE
jgi:hypothetical protein